MSDVLFGQSYYLRFDPKLWKARQPYPPLGTLYAASYLREKGYDVAFFDAMLSDSEKEWVEALDAHQPQYAVIYEDNFNYLSKMCLLRMRQAAFNMSEMAKAKGCTVIVCGSDATDHASEYFDHGVDYVLLGEGEITLGELMDHLTSGSPKNKEDILGLAWNTQNGKLQQTTMRPVIKELDELPFPAWDLVDIPRYKKIWQEHHGYYSMNLVTTRGCPYHCNWCAKPIWGQRYNVRSPENVVEEMLWIKHTHQPDHVWFADDIMGLKPGWIQEFAKLVEKNDAVIPFKSLNRADLLLMGDTIDALRRAGARTVWIGAESGSQKILDAMEKGTTVEQIYEVTWRLHGAGIQVAFFLQFGYPGETREDIELTLKMVRDCQPDDIGISVSYPLPGTTFYERVKAEFGEKQNWQDSEDLAMLYHGPYTTEFYRKLHAVVHKEFRKRKFLGEISNVIRSPNNLQKQHVRRFAAALYYQLSLPLERHKLNQLAKAPHEPTVTSGLNREIFQI
ncbi:B12-binding domain-containing radical SAM protein [candidate division KSB1 bacterium]|nr:B12-binding domain-containing radical SAM protein [candidate division KSB1 bacterium]NIR69272.1 B12-binding domain-containing radical SAM protein [candidate division KSB1 bacterium]NIS24133.1 B12-binding domain-containing radical SAM protein [candidate division KSB1 bacterium]NIT71047.1 B12-binding domain-containing radical SAM protein [candidate division KSB1 bacterium]NIU24752.1 B12-binding domain-containing radical SAM protein [candidate division KSB1 bacterium]